MRFNRVTGQDMGYFIPAGSGGLEAAGALELGPDGNLYVAWIRGGDKILRYNGTTGAFIGTFVTLPPHRSAIMSIYGPQGILFGPDGDVYLTDPGNLSAPSPGHSVMRFDGATGAYKGDFVPTRSGGLLSPRGMTWGPDGNLLVASTYSGEVLRYDGTSGFFIDRFVQEPAPLQLDIVTTLEPYLGGWTIYLDDNRNGRRDPDERSLAVSDDIDPDPPGPSYNFTDLDPSTDTVSLERYTGWRQTSHGGTVDTPPLYGLGNGVADGSSNLYRIENYATTPLAIAVGEAGVRLRDLAVDSMTGRAYGITESALYSVDVQTGAVTLVGRTGVGSLYALGYSRGTLYAMGSGDGTLYWLNAATGAATTVFNTGYPTTGDLAVDADGSLYLTTGSELVRLDVARSRATLVGNHGVAGMVGLGLDFTGALIGLRGSRTDGTAELYSIHKSTGQATLIGNVAGAASFGADGLSFDVPRIVPDTNRSTYQITITGSEIVVGVDFGIIRDESGNQPPAFTSVPPTTATVGQLLRYQGTAIDPDGDFLTYDLTLKPSGMAVDPVRGLLVWAPTPDQVGTHDVVLRVSDGRGGVALQPFSVDVGAANTPPVITSRPKGPAVVGILYQYQVVAQDGDGDAISFRLEARPAGMDIDKDTGLVSWRPAADQVGTHHTEVSADDGHGGVHIQSFDLPVVEAAANDSPTILSTPRTLVGIGDRYLYQVVATDPDGDALTFTFDTVPAGMTIDRRGLVTWIPAAQQLGPNDVAIRVSDGRGLAVIQSFTINVVTRTTNEAPLIISSPRVTAIVSKEYAYDASAHDPNGDPLVWTLQTFPVGMSIHPNQGTLRWTPSNDQLGDQQVVIRVYDPFGAFSVQTFSVRVRSVNTPPLITSAVPTTAAIDEPYTYAVRAIDPDGDPLTFALEANPVGMEISPTRGLVQWTPGAAQLGNHDVVIRVQDDQGGIARQTYTLVVVDAAANRFPVITSTPLTSAVVDLPYEYRITATDPDGDALTYVLLVRPDDMQVDANTGLVTWTPSATHLGQREVTVGAVDPAGAGGSQTFTVTVLAMNHPPAIEPIPDQSVTATLTFRYDVRASDADGQDLVYQLDNDSSAKGLVIDRLGRMAWATDPADIGAHTVVVTVIDTLGSSASRTFQLDVVPDTEAPRVTLIVEPTTVQAGEPVTIVARATDNVGVVDRGITINGVAVPLDGEGRVTILQLPAGIYSVIATARDAADNVSDTPATILTILEHSQGGGLPEVELTAPTGEDPITTFTDVIGTATDDNLAFYVLDVAPVDGNEPIEIARGRTTVTNDVLGALDPSILANDSYRLRLTAVDQDGNEASVETTVQIAGDLKIGNFTLSFTDLSIPVSGIPITVTRTYDSLNANEQGDFGFGWRLEFRDTNLRTSVPSLGPDMEELGYFNAFQPGSRVYLTPPGGRREAFTFRPRPKRGFAGLLFSEPAFEPDPGVTSQLTGPDAVLLVHPDTGEYFSANGLPYNPADTANFPGGYTLTTKDGLAYQIDPATGDLNTLTDTNENSLAFSVASIDSNRGTRVTFERDPQGRIAAVIDPAGNKVRYRYDGQGDLVAVTDREGHETRFVYGEPRRPHFLTEVIDPLGRTGMRTEYDEQGRLKKLIDAAGISVELVHDPNNSIETVVDALGRTTTFEYDARGNVVTEVNAVGGITRRTYDVRNNMLTETDPLDNITSFTYDAFDNVTSETDALANVTRFTYAQHRPGLFDRLRGGGTVSLLATTTDPLGNTTTNTYSGTNLIATTDAAGFVTKFTYDAAGNQTSIEDPAGKKTLFEYDGAGNLTKQTDALGNVTTFTYDALGNQLTETTTVTGPSGPRTVTTTTEYDANSRPTKVTDVEGGITRTEYDALGNQVATTDALSRRTEFKYDDRGQLVGLLFPDGTSTQTEYDELGRRTSSTDRAGRVTRCQYDALGRLTATIYPDDTPADDTDNPRTSTQYDRAGRVIVQTDERGNSTQFEYDAAGRQTLVRDAFGRDTHTAYDDAGRSIATTDALGRTTKFGYDKLGRQTETMFVDGTTTKSGYDALGRVITETDQLGRITQFGYDALGRLTAVVDALDQRTEYEYDQAGNLVIQRDANGHETLYEYDALGRRTATGVPLGQRSTTTYDDAGNVITTTDFNGATVQYEYDRNNRLVAKRFPDGTATQFTYTVTGQRETVTDGRGVTRFEYDARDRLVERTEPDGRTIAYTYDAAGNRTSVTAPSGTINYTFDALNRLEGVTDPDAGQTRYSYDAVGSLIRTDFPNSTTETREYDDLNRLLFLESRGPEGVINSFRYTLAPTGRRDAVTEHDGRRVTYEYDLLDRLIGEIMDEITDPDRTIRYTYDRVGNRLTRNDSAEGITTYEYDENDRLLTETLAADITRYEYDANGNTLSRIRSATDQAFYRWDFENSLIGADVTDTSGTRHVAYRYDADGIRVSSTVDGDETRYLIDTSHPFQQVLEEYTPGGIIKVSYVHGVDLISQNRVAQSGKSFYHVDRLGSTRALTNGSSLVTDSYIYDAFGRTIGRVGRTGNLYLFAGEQRDLATGLDYLRARYLDVNSGWFYGRDPFDGFLSEPVTRHRFTYAHNNPVANVDPSGQLTAAHLIATFIALDVVGLSIEYVSEARSGSELGAAQQSVAESALALAQDWAQKLYVASVNNEPTYRITYKVWFDRFGDVTQGRDQQRCEKVSDA